MPPFENEDDPDQTVPGPLDDATEETPEPPSVPIRKGTTTPDELPLKQYVVEVVNPISGGLHLRTLIGNAYGITGPILSVYISSGGQHVLSGAVRNWMALDVRPLHDAPSQVQ